MFPKADHAPSVTPQSNVVAPVARPVRLDFLSPPRSVRCRNAEMFRATMPEAAVDKDAKSSASEHEISGAAKGRQRAHVIAKPQTATMEKTPHHLLWRRFSARVGLHYPTHEYRGSSRSTAT